MEETNAQSEQYRTPRCDKQDGLDVYLDGGFLKSENKDNTQ